jgi:hypothetical protein
MEQISQNSVSQQAKQVQLKRTVVVQRTQSDPEDPHPRLDDGAFSLRFEVGEETIDSEDRSELNPGQVRHLK